MRVIGLTGPSASGKSTLAEAVRKAHGDSVIVQQDWYFRSPAECPPDANFCDLRWQFVHEFVSHVATLACGEPVEVPVVDFSTFERCGSVVLAPPSLLIVEGMTILRISELDEYLDDRFYIDIGIDVIAERKRSRDSRDRGKPTGVIETQLKWVVDEYHADEEIRQRSNVTVISGAESLESQVRAVLAGQSQG